MGVCSDQPLAQGKGVHREMESEGSQRQSSDPRDTNTIRRETWGKIAPQVEARKLHGHVSVNDAGTWNESESSYRGRPHGQVEAE